MVLVVRHAFSFEQVVRPYIPVIAHTKVKHEPLPELPRPVCGIRWGKPSRFEFSNEDREPEPDGSSIIEDPEDVKRITATEVFRKWEKVTAPAVDEPSITFEFERPSELIFFVEETETKEETTNDNGNIQEEITHTFHYIRIGFTLNAPGEQIGASGERGEHPDDTLAQAQQEYNNTVAGGVQKSKELWEGMFSG